MYNQCSSSICTMWCSKRYHYRIQSYHFILESKKSVSKPYHRPYKITYVYIAPVLLVFFFILRDQNRYQTLTVIEVKLSKMVVLNKAVITHAWLRTTLILLDSYTAAKPISASARPRLQYCTHQWIITS
jgi:hypothetical protein